MRDFFKYVFANLLSLILFSALSLGAFVALIVGIAFTAQEPEPRIKRDSMLVFDLSVEITDSQPTSTASEVIGEALSGTSSSPTIALRTVLDALEAAANDDRIAGLYLDGNVQAVGSGSGFATLREVRQALLDFKESGKPIIAYEMTWNERDYYLTSVADTIVLNPNGLLEFNGFKSESLFFGAALDRLGIGVSPVRVGQYKSAVEPFIQNQRSPQEREQSLQLITELWTEFLQAASESRNLTPEALQQIANDQGLLLPDAALSAQLIDKVAYFDDLLVDVRELTNEGSRDASDSASSFRQVSLGEYANAVTDDLLGNVNSDRQIAVVYAEGSIVNGEGGVGQIGGDRFARLVRSLREDDDVKAVVLRVNSPGGSASASDIIAHEIQLTRDVKPVVVSMGSLAASGGYLISTYGDQIFASPNTITGSIGVFGLLPNVQELANKNGVTWDIVKTGELADLGTVSRPPSEAELSIIQNFVNKTYDDFLTSVADSRPISREQLEPIAQGRVWTGIRAEELGLVDDIGGLEMAIADAAERAELDNWDVVEYPRVRSFEEQVLEQFLSDYTGATQTDPDVLSDYLRRLWVEVETVRSLNDPRGVYSRIPIHYWID
ncbi:MAG: signal peptide peptidase SppA [Elainellaceae cyanobacterium]